MLQSLFVAVIYIVVIYIVIYIYIYEIVVIYLLLQRDIKLNLGCQYYISYLTGRLARHIRFVFTILIMYTLV